MRREDVKDFYILIRLWAPPEEEDPDRPRYACHTFPEDGGVEWSVTRNWLQAAFFKSADIAKRIVRNVAPFKSRVARGWGYEVIKVTEECLDTNINFGYEEDAA